DAERALVVDLAARAVRSEEVEHQRLKRLLLGAGDDMEHRPAGAGAERQGRDRQDRGGEETHGHAGPPWLSARRRSWVCCSICCSMRTRCWRPCAWACRTPLMVSIRSRLVWARVSISTMPF